MHRPYNDPLRAIPPNLMQNISIDIPILAFDVPAVGNYQRAQNTALDSAIAVLQKFSGRTVPRKRCTITFLLVCGNASASPLFEASFVRVLAEMTGFDTVVLSLVYVTKEVGEAMLPETLDKWLGGKLGPRKEERSKDGRVDYLTYHPRRHVEYQEATLVRLS